MLRRPLLKGVLIIVALMAAVATGGAVYLIRTGQAIEREVMYRSYGNTQNPEVKQLVSGAFRSAFDRRDFKRALLQMERAHEIEPRNRAVSFRRAKLMLHCGRQEEARLALQDLSTTRDFFGKSAAWVLDEKNFSRLAKDPDFF